MAGESPIRCVGCLAVGPNSWRRDLNGAVIGKEREKVVHAVAIRTRWGRGRGDRHRTAADYPGLPAATPDDDLPAGRVIRKNVGDDFDLDVRSVDSAPAIAALMCATGDNCGGACSSACTNCRS